MYTVEGWSYHKDEGAWYLGQCHQDLYSAHPCIISCYEDDHSFLRCWWRPPQWIGWWCCWPSHHLLLTNASITLLTMPPYIDKYQAIYYAKLVLAQSWLTSPLYWLGIHGLLVPAIALACCGSATVSLDQFAIFVYIFWLGLLWALLAILVNYPKPTRLSLDVIIKIFVTRLCLSNTLAVSSHKVFATISACSKSCSSHINIANICHNEQTIISMGYDLTASMLANSFLL